MILNYMYSCRIIDSGKYLVPGNFAEKIIVVQDS
jgi:hypothetical protein